MIEVGAERERLEAALAVEREGLLHRAAARERSGERHLRARAGEQLSRSIRSRSNAAPSARCNVVVAPS